MKILKREELKDFSGGRVAEFTPTCLTGNSCSYYESGTGNVSGTCNSNSNGVCYCGGANSAAVNLSGCMEY